MQVNERLVADPSFQLWIAPHAGGRGDAEQFLADLPHQHQPLESAPSFQSIAARIQKALAAHGLCDCLPANGCNEDRTLRKAKTPDVTDCRVEPPPPQRRDPFIFRAKVGPMEEILILNLDQLDEHRRPVVVHRQKNGSAEVASVIVPDDNPKMPRTGDHVVVLARKYTNQVVDGENVSGPWSDPHICRVQPPRDARGELVRGYSEDMREPYLFKQDIGFCSEGDVRAPGKRLFYSTAPFTIAPGTELRLYANAEIQTGGERWVEIGKTTSTLSGMFALEACSPIGGDEGYRMEIVQPGRKDPILFDPIVHPSFASDPNQVSKGLADQLFDVLPIDTTFDVTGGPRVREYATFALCSPAIAPFDQVKIMGESKGCEPVLVEADRRGSVTGKVTADPGDQASAIVKKQIDGKAIWVPLGSFVVGAERSRVEGSALPIVLGPNAGLKPGQRIRAVNEETDVTTVATAGLDGSVALVLPNTSRGDFIRYEIEDWVDNQRTWLPLFAAQVDSARACDAPREKSFSSTVDAPPSAEGWAKLSEIFSVGAGKDVPADRRRLFLFGASFGLRTSGYHLTFEQLGFQADATTLEVFRRGFDFGRSEGGGCLHRISRVDATKIEQGRTYNDSRRVEERCTPTVYNISGLSGRFRTEHFTRKTPDQISIAENPFAITSKVAQAGGY